MSDSKAKRRTAASKRAGTAPCACSGAAAGRRAVGVSPEIKAASLNRLRRIEGQVRGVARMVEEERHCADVLMQVAAIQEALRAVSRGMMRNHLEHCATAAIKAGSERADEMYDELVELMWKSAR